MSTRSYIGRQYDDGSIRIVYCHFDGYPSHNGAILLKHYDAAKLEELLALGNISVLAEDIGVKHDFNDRSVKTVKAYGRDRGEKDQEATVFFSLSALVNSLPGSGIEYAYLLIGFPDGDEWYYASVYDQETYDSHGDISFNKLTEEVVNND